MCSVCMFHCRRPFTNIKISLNTLLIQSIARRVLSGLPVFFSRSLRRDKTLTTRASLTYKQKRLQIHTQTCKLTLRRNCGSRTEMSLDRRMTLVQTLFSESQSFCPGAVLLLTREQHTAFSSRYWGTDGQRDTEGRVHATQENDLVAAVQRSAETKPAPKT